MRSINILIIDDSAAFNKLTKRSIEKAGIECSFSEASNGRRALDFLAEAMVCPDVILLDMNMPVMDGFDFLAEYSRETKCYEKSLVYMLTSSALEKDKIKAAAYPVLKAYFEKPLTPENIRQIVADVQAIVK